MKVIAEKDASSVRLPSVNLVDLCSILFNYARSGENYFFSGEEGKNRGESDGDGVSRQTDPEKWAESTFCFPKPVFLHLAACFGQET